MHRCGGQPILHGTSPRKENGSKTGHAASSRGASQPTYRRTPIGSSRRRTLQAEARQLAKTLLGQALFPPAHGGGDSPPLPRLSPRGREAGRPAAVTPTSCYRRQPRAPARCRRGWRRSRVPARTRSPRPSSAPTPSFPGGLKRREEERQENGSGKGGGGGGASSLPSFPAVGGRELARLARLRRLQGQARRQQRNPGEDGGRERGCRLSLGGAPFPQQRRRPREATPARRSAAASCAFPRRRRRLPPRRTAQLPPPPPPPPQQPPPGPEAPSTNCISAALCSRSSAGTHPPQQPQPPPPPEPRLASPEGSPDTRSCSGVPASFLPPGGSDGNSGACANMASASSSPCRSSPSLLAGWRRRLRCPLLDAKL